MSQTWQNVLLLALTAVAAVGGVTGVVLLVYAWIDRPQALWRMGARRPQVHERREANGQMTEIVREAKREERHEVGLEIQPIGDAVAYDVHIRFPGAHQVGATGGVYAPQMTLHSDPLTARLVIPALGKGSDQAWLEITWHLYRPHRHLAQRLNLRTDQLENWRWNWRSIRPRRAGKYWFRLTRTRGRWVPAVSRRCPTVPEGLPAVGGTTGPPRAVTPGKPVGTSVPTSTSRPGGPSEPSGTAGSVGTGDTAQSRVPREPGPCR